MHRQSAVSTLPGILAVGEGVLAPGHLGELTKYVRFELVDAILEETGTVERRRRILPSRVGIYFVLALGLFPQLGYAKVWNKLVAGLTGLPVVTPSEKALRDLRRRLGAAPLKALFEVVAGPLAQPRTPGARYRQWRTVAFDGCSSIKVPDGERNYAWLGRVRHRLGITGYPTLRLMSLVETGTRGLLGAAFGPKRHGENHYARKLLHLLGDDSLVLADRGFDDGKFLLRPTTPAFLSRRHPSQTPASPTKPGEPTLIDRAYAVLRSEPGRRWGPRELAQAVNADNVHSYAVLLARWARNGLIHKPHTGVYMLLDEAAPAASPPTPPPLAPGTPQLQGTLAVLRSAPDYSWTPHEVASALGTANVNSLNAQMAKWARRGLIYQTRRGAYAAHSPDSPEQQPLTDLDAP
ncbi:transposase domain-containing protein [Streptomyces sp. C11-1]|uniref:transposase domain-containing protein n=1 Tax=Streptomyces sp. C11-1 TaxID=3444503 RepID=UPI0037D9BE14